MNYAASKNKKMPYEMHIFNIFHFVEYNSKGIKKSANEKKHHSGERNNGNYVFDTHYNRPAHENVENHGNLLKLFEVNGIEHNAKGGAKSIDSKKCPAKGTLKHPQTYWCVCTKNQKENGAMVKYSEHAFCFSIGK